MSLVVRSTRASPIVRFYAGDAPDSRGRLLAGIQGWDDARLEAVHDTIQWLFPLPEPSGFNPGAPLLTAEDIAAFHRGPALRAALLASWQRMRRFYGLPHGAGHWLTPGNHNMLRLSRILRCLHLLGLQEEAEALLRDLETLHTSGHARAIGPVTLGHWRRAVR